MTKRRSRKLLLIPFVVALAVVTVAVVTVVHRHAPATVQPSTSSGSSVDQLQLGATLTQKTGLAETLPTGLLDRSVDVANVSLSGDGTGNPEPSPGVYDWSSLDARMHQVAPLHAMVSMRVFEAPPWMTGGKAKAAVRPRFYKAFADLVVAAARRYPQIRYFAIWNELSGYRTDPAHWNYEAYTRLYNVVYTALKALSADLQVGGPYAPFPPAPARGVRSSLTGPWGAIDQNSLDAVSYWLDHKVGADFIAIDGRTAQPTIVPKYPAAATNLFSTVDRWIAAQTPLPIWWMEWYARSPQLGAAEWNAVSAYALVQIAASGARTALIWDSEFIPGRSTSTPGLWVAETDAETSLTPVFESLRVDMFGTQVKLASPDPGVVILENANHFIAIELDGSRQSVVVLGKTVILNSYAIVTG
jgi:hypothetical protein